MFHDVYSFSTVTSTRRQALSYAIDIALVYALHEITMEICEQGSTS